MGIQLCNSLRYQIYLSDSLTGNYNLKLCRIQQGALAAAASQLQYCVSKMGGFNFQWISLCIFLDFKV